MRWGAAHGESIIRTFIHLVMITSVGNVVQWWYWTRSNRSFLCFAIDHGKGALARRERGAGCSVRNGPESWNALGFANNGSRGRDPSRACGGPWREGAAFSGAVNAVWQVRRGTFTVLERAGLREPRIAGTRSLPGVWRSMAGRARVLARRERGVASSAWNVHGLGTRWASRTTDRGDAIPLGRVARIFSTTECKAKPGASLRLRPAAFFTHRH